MFRVIIAGSRFFNDYEEFEKEVIKDLFELNKKYPQYNILTIDHQKNLYKMNRSNFEIISGMASGADTLAVKFATKYNLRLVEFPADWKNLDVSPCKIMTNEHGVLQCISWS